MNTSLTNRSHLLLPLAVALGVVGCGTSDTMPTSPTYSTAAQLSGLQAYVAIGNSLTAGYQSGAWGNPDHVATSYPNLIARQVGITGFKQVSLTGTGLAMVDSDGDGVPDRGNMVVNFTATGSPVLSYTATDPANLTALATGAGTTFDFSAPRNFGIPGISLMHAAGAPLGQYAAGNPYASFYTNAESAPKTQVQLAAEAGAGFITCWLGNNDVLGYVTSGGTGAITPAALFQASLDGTLAALGATPRLVVINLPSVTAIPYVTYFNPVLIGLLDQMGAPVHAVWAMDDALGAAVPLYIDPGTNNYVLLPAASAMAADPTLGASSANPLPDALVLDAAELAAAQAAVADFNARLAAGVAALNTPQRELPALLVDMHAYFNEVAAGGLHYGGQRFTTQFVSGGLFSLDGVHPTSLGNAAVANEIIAAMNEGWGLNVAEVDLAEFIGVNIGLGSAGVPPLLPDFRQVVELFQH
ncbi:MAG: SGNH/GDSL hydrolase family protein [bacterium]|jgi:lysophospholipase L1-like esterase|nr:SGNH/GDSL hydrolase family protein [bacterium]